MSTLPAPVNFAYWDTVSEFLQQEIGWLWCGLEPPGPQGKSTNPAILPMMGQRVIAEMNAAIKKKEFPVLSRYPRGVLRDWAEQQNYQPSFLFPELRAQARNSLNLDDALQIIDALASMQKRYGLITKIEQAIQQAGGNLNRNSISKYLKVIKK